MRKKALKENNHNRTYYDNLIELHKGWTLIGAIIGVIAFILDALGIISIH